MRADGLRGWQVLGESGARDTMRRMAKNVRASLGEVRMTQTARNIVARLDERDRQGQARLLRQWTDSHFRFVNDPLGVELIESPAFLLDEVRTRGFVQGDCDDAATLCAALGMSVGVPATFTAYAFVTPRAPFSHVVAHLWPFGFGGKPVECDITRPKGLRPPKVTRRLTVRV